MSLNVSDWPFLFCFVDMSVWEWLKWESAKFVSDWKLIIVLLIVEEGLLSFPIQVQMCFCLSLSFYVQLIFCLVGLKVWNWCANVAKLSICKCCEVEYMGELGYREFGAKWNWSIWGMHYWVSGKCWGLDKGYTFCLIAIKVSIFGTWKSGFPGSVFWSFALSHFTYFCLIDPYVFLKRIRWYERLSTLACTNSLVK